MKTLNSDILCAIDTETTGLRAGWHDMIELAILPLWPDFTPNPNIEPFSMLIQPDHIDRIDQRAMKVNKISMTDLLQSPHLEDVNMLFEDWFDKQLSGFKQIQVLAQNWVFDQGFLQHFFGWSNKHKSWMDDFFNLRKGVRDTKIIVNYLNDLAEYNNQDIPFPKTSLSYLCSQLDIERLRSHRALDDCYATAEVYRRLHRLYLTQPLVF